jgi:hypothetical protein
MYLLKIVLCWIPMAVATKIGEPVPIFNLHIMDGKEAEVEIEATNSHEAIETGVTALAQFVCKHFPPPENLQVNISNEQGRCVATVSFAFNIKIAPGVAN